jgi:hypothetical protein
MKRVFLFFTLFTLTLASCSDIDTPAPVPPTPNEEKILDISTPNPIMAIADGGWYYFQFTIINPIEGAQLNVECEADWISGINVDQEMIYFDVLPNETGESRSATLIAHYGDAEQQLFVEQMGSTSEMPYLSGIYYGNEYGATEKDYNYSVVLSSRHNALDIVTGEANIIDGHKYLFLDLYASKPSDNYNISFTIPEGEYILDVDDSATSGTISANYTSYLSATGMEVLFVSGKVVVTENRIEANLVDEDGNEYVFYTNQTYIDNSKLFYGDWVYHGDMSMLTEDKVVVLDNCSIIGSCEGDYYIVGKNYWWFTINGYDGECNNSLKMWLLTPIEDAYPVGEYPVSTDLNLEQMALPSYINSYGTTDWSWYKWKMGDNDGYAPIVDGMMTIVDKGDKLLNVTFSFVDDKGFKITGECEAQFRDTTNYM